MSNREYEQGRRDENQQFRGRDEREFGGDFGGFSMGGMERSWREPGGWRGGDERFGRDFGREYGRDYPRDFGRDYPRDFGRDYPRDYGRSFDRDERWARDLGRPDERWGRGEWSPYDRFRHRDDFREHFAYGGMDRGYGEMDRGYRAFGDYGWGQPLQRRVGRPPKGYQRSDERIKEDLCDHLMRSWIDAENVEIQVRSGEVTLSGTVDERRAKRAIEDIAELILGVEDVQNNIRVLPDEHSAAQSASRKPLA